MTNDVETMKFFSDMTNAAMHDMIDEAIEISMSVPDETYPEAAYGGMSIAQINDALDFHDYETWLDTQDRY